MHHRNADNFEVNGPSFDSITKNGRVTVNREKRLKTDLNVKEVVQAGDVFLLRFDCFNCFEENFEGFPLKTCSSCLVNLEASILEIPTGRFKKRLLAGSKRKPTRLGKKIIRELFSAQGEACAYCLIELTGNYHVEHIRPICVGGTNAKSNLVLSCPPCNLIAGSKVFNSFNAKKVHILSLRGSNGP